MGRRERFRRRVAGASDQLLRYWHWDGSGDVHAQSAKHILWVTSHSPTLDPRCAPSPRAIVLLNSLTTKVRAQ